MSDGALWAVSTASTAGFVSCAGLLPRGADFFLSVPGLLLRGPGLLPRVGVRVSPTTVTGADSPTGAGAAGGSTRRCRPVALSYTSLVDDASTSCSHMVLPFGDFKYGSSWYVSMYLSFMAAVLSPAGCEAYTSVISLHACPSQNAGNEDTAEDTGGWWHGLLNLLQVHTCRTAYRCHVA